jgi:hypothetical protein
MIGSIGPRMTFAIMISLVALFVALGHAVISRTATKRPQ